MMFHRGTMIIMLLLAVANCVDWVHTFPTSGSLEQEIFKGFTGRQTKNTQVKCSATGLTCDPWKEKTSIVDKISFSNWQDKFRAAVTEILDECAHRNACKAVNFDWVAICASPPSYNSGGAFVPCAEADHKYDYVGIVLAYQLAIAPSVAPYSITLSTSDNYWTVIQNTVKQTEIEMYQKLWTEAGNLPGHFELDKYKNTRAMLHLYDFIMWGKNKPECQPTNDCPTAPGLSFATFESTNFLASEDCKAQDFGKVAGLGYNIITGSPMASDDQGYKASPVFKSKGGYETTESPKTQNGCPIWKWKYPKGFSVQTSYKLNAEASTGSMYSEQSYQQSSSTRVSTSVQGEYVGASFGFTGSADFQSFSKNVQKQKMVEVRQYQEAPAFVSSVHLFDLEFTDNYLKSLAAAYKNNGDFSAFIDTYGTHITTEVRSGARFSQVSKFTMENYESLKSNSQAFEVGMKASYEGITGKVDSKITKSEEAKNAFEGKRETWSKMAVGGNHATLKFDQGGEEEFIELAHQYPEMLSAVVFPHSKLIQSRWDDIAKAIPDVDQAKFFDFYGKFIKNYCNGFESKCMASSTDPPQPMTLKWDDFVDSDLVGSTDCSKSPCEAVDFRQIRDFKVMRDTVTISRIQMQCKEFDHGMRVAALRFHLTDYTNSIQLIALGNWDPNSKWTKDEPLSPVDRIVSVQVRGGLDVDFIQFTISNSHGPLRQVGCGGSGGSEVVPINLVGYRLLDYAGSRDVKSGFIRAIRFRKFKTEFKSEHANQLHESRKQAENQQFYQSLISLGKDMASEESHSLREASFMATPQTPQTKEHAHGMWGTIENFEEKFQRMEDTVAKIVDVLLKVEHCASASSSPSPSYSRSADEDDRRSDRGDPSKRGDPSQWR